MILTPRQCKILRVANFRVDDTEQELAKKIRIKPHVLRYELQQALAAELIRPSCSIDFYRLGLSQYQYYFSLSTVNSKIISNVKNFFNSSPNVAWGAFLGGGFQFATSLCCLDEKTLLAAEDKLINSVGKGFLKRQISTVIQVELYPKKYLFSEYKSQEYLAYEKSQTQLELDQIDWKILTGLIATGGVNNSKVARVLNIPRTTLVQRITKLKEYGVLGPNIFLINANKLGFVTARVLLFLAHDNSSCLKLMQDFCRSHPNIVSMLRLLGAWEYEVTIEAENLYEVQNVVWKLAEQLGSWLRNYEVLPVFEQIRSSRFLVGVA